MLKKEFLDMLRIRLAGLPEDEVEERIGFYSEMIDDRIEEGSLEEEAVLAVGSVDEIAEQIIADIPLMKIAREKIKPRRRMSAWETVLLTIGSPIWLSLAIVAFAVILSVYVVLWSVIASIWAAFAAFVGSAIGGILSGAVFAFCGNLLTGLATVGAGIALSGLSIFLFFGCREATKGTLFLTKKIAIGIKRCFMRREEA